MNQPPKSTESPIPPDKSQLSFNADSEPASQSIVEESFVVAPVGASEMEAVSEYEGAPSAPWWKTSSKALLGVGVFTGLTVVILFVTGMSKMGTSGMEGDGMEGMDMSGMSMDDMMGVDGAFNATPVTVEEVKLAKLDVSVNYTGAIYPYSEVTVYPRVAGQLSNYSVYPGDRVNAGQTLATLDAIERTSQTGEAEAAVTALLSDVDVSRAEVEEQRQQIDQVQADLEYLRLQRDRFASLTAAGATPKISTICWFLRYRLKNQCCKVPALSSTDCRHK